MKTEKVLEVYKENDDYVIKLINDFKKKRLIIIILMILLLTACSGSDDSNHSIDVSEGNILGSWEQVTNDNVVGYLEIKEDIVIHISADSGEYSPSEDYILTETENNTVILHESNNELILEGYFQDEDTIQMIDFQGATQEMMDENEFKLVRIDNLEEELEDFYALFDNPEEDNNESTLDILNMLAENSEDTKEIYITNDIVVGENEDVKPGIYDLEIIGGMGNIFGQRSSVHSLPVNWAVADKDNSAGYPSTIRIILFNEDVLSFKDISKVKFNATSKDVEPSNELGIGQFIVGRDISPGEYKLSTNVELDPKFDNLGWSIKVYNDEDDKSREQMLTPTNSDVVVKLSEGEIITTSYTNTDYGSNSDDARLIFEEH